MDGLKLTYEEILIRKTVKETLNDLKQIDRDTVASSNADELTEAVKLGRTRKENRLIRMINRVRLLDEAFAGKWIDEKLPPIECASGITSIFVNLKLSNGKIIKDCFFNFDIGVWQFFDDESTETVCEEVVAWKGVD